MYHERSTLEPLFLKGGLQDDGLDCDRAAVTSSNIFLKLQDNYLLFWKHGETLDRIFRQPCHG